MPDPERLLNTLRRAVDAFRATPGRQGRFIDLADVADVLVAGDLHGNLDNFKKLLLIADLNANPRRHLVLQELVHGPFQYPNGGDKSHRLLDLVAALKCQYLERVHFLLGNHELSQWTRRAIMKADQDLNDLFVQGIQTAYGDRADDVLAAYDDVFAALPVIIRTPNRVLLSHSLPGGSRLPHWHLEQITREQHQPDDLKLGGAIHAVVWGRDLSLPAALAYLAKTDADWLITGHIPCDDGFQLPNDRQLILDCKEDNGCCCLVPADRSVAMPDLTRALIRLSNK